MSTEKQRESWRKANQKYRQTVKGKQAARKAELTRQNTDKRKEYRQTYLGTVRGRAYILGNNAKSRAVKYDLPFDLSLDWITSKLELGVCEVSGIALVLISQETYGMHNNMQPFSPCIDKINPELGYLESNCRLVCNIFNQCKMHWTDSDVSKFVKAYYEENNLGRAL